MIKIKGYFKGYYFKCSNENETIAFIPALHFDDERETASLQIITKSSTYTINYDKIVFDEKNFKIKIGNNDFSTNGINLNIKTDNLFIQGKINFGKFEKIKYDIMGPFQYIPFMQCSHAVVSMAHSLNGKITVNDKDYCFYNDIGYIEGDKGCSFPKEYIWTHCHFGKGSLMLSVADIPFLGFNFKGIIGIIMINGKEYRIATYLGAKVKLIKKNTIIVTQGKYTLIAKLIKSKNQSLNAPNIGIMSRTIKESVVCTASYKFICDNKVLVDFTSDMASFEYEFKD